MRRCPPTVVIGAGSDVLDAVESQPARAFARPHALAAREPEGRRAVDPARVLELAHQPQAAAGHLLLKQAEVAALRLEDAAERAREAGAPALVDQRGGALEPDVRLLRVDALWLERDPVVGDARGEQIARVPAPVLGRQ